jgi:hypothetical protein
MLLVLLWPNVIWHIHPAVTINAASKPELSDEEVQQVFEQQRRQNEKESN